MSTPLPGQIRCPTCQRSTPPAAFCTQCGTAIPDSARARPRGLDREELQDRIRTHRPGDAAFRRGSQVGGGDPSSSAYRPYQPEPEDELVLPGAAADEADAPRVDNAPPDVDAPPPPVVPPAPAPVEAAGFVPPPVISPAAPPAEPPAAARVAEPAAPAAVPPPPVATQPPAPRQPKPAPWKPKPPPLEPVEPLAAPPAAWSAIEEPDIAEADGAGYGYRGRGGDWNRRGSGMSPLAIGGFVLLGVLAIGVGAFMAGLFSGGAAVGSPSPTPLVSTLPSSSGAGSLSPSTAPSAAVSAGATATPVAIGDAFTATTQPCAEQPASQDGCGSSGATVTGGTVWVWIGWKKGSDADALGVTIVDATGATVGTGGPLALSTIGTNGCGASCNGWARFKFGGLNPGDYTIRVDRNGTQVAEATFTVNA